MTVTRPELSKRWCLGSKFDVAGLAADAAVAAGAAGVAAAKSGVRRATFTNSLVLLKF